MSWIWLDQLPRPCQGNSVWQHWQLLILLAWEPKENKMNRGTKRNVIFSKWLWFMTGNWSLRSISKASKGDSHGDYWKEDTWRYWFLPYQSFVIVRFFSGPFLFTYPWVSERKGWHHFRRRMVGIHTKGCKRWHQCSRHQLPCHRVFVQALRVQHNLKWYEKDRLDYL